MCFVGGVRRVMIDVISVWWFTAGCSMRDVYFDSAG